MGIRHGRTTRLGSIGISLVLALGICIHTVTGVLVQRESFTPSPPFKGRQLPIPPQQSSPWEAPDTALSGEFVDACRVLFEQGFADPRGCKYRVIEVATGSLSFGDSGAMITHGWVLPNTVAREPRFAVCWNGLVYPVLSTGEDADLRGDVLAAFEADKPEAERRQEMERRFHGPEEVQKAPELLKWRPWLAQDERTQLSAQTVHPLKSVMLLRLGETALAERMWHLWRDPLIVYVYMEGLDNHPYGLLAKEWVWARSNRTLCAFMRSDDNLAAIGVERLMALEPQIQAAATERGVPADKILALARQLPRLKADLERRAAEPGEPEFFSMRATQGQGWRVRQAAAEKWQSEMRRKHPDKQERAVVFTRMLDELCVPQMGQPGSVVFVHHPVVIELIRIGEPAIQPLLEVLENSESLTRSVEYWRDHAFSREMLGVERPAWEALKAILKGDFFEERVYYVPQWKGRDEAIAEIKLLLEKHRGVSPAERGELLRNGFRLRQAIEDGEVGVVKDILERHPELSNHQTDEHVLMMAALRGNAKMVRLLLEHGADVSAREFDGATALHRAVFSQSPEVVRLLLEAGIDVNARNADGRTALHVALALSGIGTPEDRRDVIVLLLEHGADVSIRDKAGRTPPECR